MAYAPPVKVGRASEQVLPKSPAWVASASADKPDLTAASAFFPSAIKASAERADQAAALPAAGSLAVVVTISAWTGATVAPTCLS